MQTTATITETKRNLGTCEIIDGRERTMHHLTQRLSELGHKVVGFQRLTGEMQTVVCGYADWTIVEDNPPAALPRILRRYGVSA
jgi:hypothetical protein